MNPHISTNSACVKVLLCWTTLLLAVMSPAQVSQSGNTISSDLSQTNESIAPPDLGPSGIALTGWQGNPLDEFSTEWTKTETVTNVATGVAQPVVHRLTSVGNGLNYIDANGVLRASVDSISLMTNTGGAAALYGPTKVYFSPTLGDGETVTMVNSTGLNPTTLKIAPLGLYFVDDAGKSVLLGSVRNGAEGELIPPNTVVYRSALTGLLCDLRIVYTHGACESDLILREALQPPEAYGLNSASTRLRLLHLIQGPLPSITSRAIGQNLVDQVLDYGEVKFPLGYAFSSGDSDDGNIPALGVPAEVRLPSGSSSDTRVPVMKSLVQVGGQTCLAEDVRWSDVQPQIQSLPPAQQGAKLETPIKQASLGLELPGLKRREHGKAFKPMKIASAGLGGKGFTIDYITVTGSGGFTFNSGVTYYIGSMASFGGTVTFQPNCYIKVHRLLPALRLSGPITCNGTSANPSIITSENDNAFGEILPWSTGTLSYSGGPMVQIYYETSQVTLNGMQLRWAQTAVEVDGNVGDGLTHNLANSSIQWCQTGLYVNNSSVSLQYSTKCSVGTPTNGTGTWNVSGSLSDICNGNDSNGLPLSWEYEYFGQSGINLTGDPDGDGLSNQQEYQNGTNPQLCDIPQIQAPPQNLLVARGNTANFTVAATGTGNLTYQWYRESQAIAGATNSSYSITNVQLANSDYYSVVVVNTVGSNSIAFVATSPSAFLSVATPSSGVPVPSGAIAWWPGESNTTDAIGANNGTWYNGALYSTGKVNYGFQFNGSNSYVQVADAPALELTNALTIEFWVRRLRVNSSFSEYTIEKGGDWSSGGQQNYAVQLHAGDNGLCFTWAGGYRIAGSISDTTTNHHCAVVVTNGAVNPVFYVDGVQQSIFSSSGGNINMIPSTRALHLGAQVDPVSGYNYYSDTVVDEMSIYNRGLSPYEIQAIYNAGSAGKYSPPAPPLITSQPQTIVGLPGTNATFSVAASGSTPYSYQWFFNGSPISGATSSSYTVSNAQTANVGTYAVVVANSGGSVWSAGASLILVGPCVEPPVNLISWWRAEGNAIDGVWTNNGQLMGTATYTSGEVGQAFSFSGSSGCYVQVLSSSSLQLSNSFTIELWFKDTGSSGWYGLLAKRSTTSPYPCNYGINANVTGNYMQVYFLDPTTSSSFQISTISPLPTANVFHHLAAVYQQTTSTNVQITTYIDGSPKQTNTFSGKLTGTFDNSPVTIGASNSTGDWFKGFIDEATIYSRALTASEISSIYNAATSGKCWNSSGDGLPDWWDLLFGFNPWVNNANADPDGDGYTNLEEYRNRTNPLVADPHAAIFEPKLWFGIP